MEHYEISKLLSDSTVSKFVTRNWIEVNNWSSRQYSFNKNIKFKKFNDRISVIIVIHILL